MQKFIYFIFCLLCLTLVWNQEHRASWEIQKDIDHQHTDLISLRAEVQQLERQIQEKERAAYSVESIIRDLDHKIQLTEKLVRSLSREERLIRDQIEITQNAIEEKNGSLSSLQLKLRDVVVYLYKSGKPTFLEILLLSENWDDMVYRVKYLESINRHKDTLMHHIEQTVQELEAETESYNQELVNVQKLRDEKNRENENMVADKARRDTFKKQLESEKSGLEKQLNSKKQMVAELENLIKQLLKDKSSAQEYEAELVRIREAQQMATEGNFKDLRGRLPWPVSGQIVNQYGIQYNEALKTKTENPGIDLKAAPGSDIVTVLDGIVSRVSFLHGYKQVIIISHGSGYHTVYANVDQIQVTEKEYVKSGMLIAKVSKTEIANGGAANFHFEVWGENEKFNPEHWLSKK